MPILRPIRLALGLTLVASAFLVGAPQVAEAGEKITERTRFLFLFYGDPGAGLYEQCSKHFAGDPEVTVLKPVATATEMVELLGVLGVRVLRPTTPRLYMLTPGKGGAERWKLKQIFQAPVEDPAIALRAMVELRDG